MTRRLRSIRRSLVAVGLGTLGLSCGSVIDIPPGQVPSVTPDNAVLIAGDSLELTSSYKGRNPCVCLWGTSAPAIATVSATGVVRAVTPGYATITATAKSDPNAKRSVLVEVRPFARDNAPNFQSDSISYTLRAGDAGFEGNIVFTFTNRSGVTAYIVNCSGATQLRFEKQVAGQWTPAWSPVVNLCLSPPIIVPAGASYESRLWVFSGYTGTNVYPQFFSADIAGEYRAVWTDVLSSYNENASPFGTALPFDQRLSNRFLLSTQPR